MTPTNDAATPMLRMVAIQFVLLITELLISLFEDSLRHEAIDLFSVYMLSEAQQHYDMHSK
jgi:hypothetical protein